MTAARKHFKDRYWKKVFEAHELRIPTKPDLCRLREKSDQRICWYNTIDAARVLSRSVDSNCANKKKGHLSMSSDDEDDDGARHEETSSAILCRHRTIACSDIDWRDSWRGFQRHHHHCRPRWPTRMKSGESGRGHTETLEKNHSILLLIRTRSL